MQNDRLYKKAYNDHKAKVNIPADMVSIYAAKEGQALASNVDYRQYLHQWSCFPDQNDVIQARKAYDLQSDVSASPGKKVSHGLVCGPLPCSGEHTHPYRGPLLQHYPKYMKHLFLLPHLIRVLIFIVK